jgi:hypothetical protein
MPPTSRHLLNNLPHILMTIDDIDEENIAECVICLESLTIASICCKLDCGHIFHPLCAKNWLQKHCTCPKCRYEFATDDSLFEFERKARMRNRKLRLRKDELHAKSAKQLRELLDFFGSRYADCFDKIDLVERLIQGGFVDLQPRAAPIDFTRYRMNDGHFLRHLLSSLSIFISSFYREGIYSQSVSELKQMLRAFGVSADGALEKSELVDALLASGRIVLVTPTSLLCKSNDQDNTKKDFSTLGVDNPDFKAADSVQDDNRTIRPTYNSTESSSSSSISTLRDPLVSSTGGNEVAETHSTASRYCSCWSKIS